MTDNAKIEAKLWKALRSDMTIMLGLVGVDEGHAQPMIAQFADDEDHGPIRIFTSKETDLVKAMGADHQAVANFASKGHDLFASIEGRLVADNDPAMIDKLWSPFVAAWFEGGKTDPKLQLLRFDLSGAQVWLNEHSLLAGVKMLLGADPKKAYKDKVAELPLH